MLLKPKLKLLSFLFIICCSGSSYIYAKGIAHDPGKIDPSPVSGKFQKGNYMISSNSDSYNSIYFGPGILRYGNSKFHYKAYGFNIGGTHLLTDHIGLTVEGGMYWHNAYSISYRLANIAAGATVMPFNGPNDDEYRFTFSIHALGGITSYGIKNSKAGLNANQTSFAMNIGAAEDCLISSNFKIRIQADVLPTFFNSEFQYSYRLSLGAVFNLP